MIFHGPVGGIPISPGVSLFGGLGAAPPTGSATSVACSNEWKQSTSDSSEMCRCPRPGMVECRPNITVLQEALKTLDQLKPNRGVNPGSVTGVMNMQTRVAVVNAMLVIAPLLPSQMKYLGIAVAAAAAFSGGAERYITENASAIASAILYAVSMMTPSADAGDGGATPDAGGRGSAGKKWYEETWGKVAIVGGGLAVLVLLLNRPPAARPALSGGGSRQKKRARRGEERRITTTFETFTPDDLEAGEPSETGWIDEEGETFENVDEAIRFLKRKGATQASDTESTRRTWYMSEPDVNYRTGAETGRHYHLEHFTDDERKRIHRALTR